VAVEDGAIAFVWMPHARAVLSSATAVLAPTITSISVSAYPARVPFEQSARQISLSLVSPMPRAIAMAPVLDELTIWFQRLREPGRRSSIEQGCPGETGFCLF
jgi:hypothetical protein